MSDDPRERFRATYRDEAHDLLDELESSLLTLDERPDDAEIVARVFRALHTIKGSGKMLGFDEVAAIVHEAEEVFDRIRSGRLQVDHDIVDMVLAVCDHVKGILDGSAGDEDRTEAIRAALRHLVAGGGHGGDDREAAAHAAIVAEPGGRRRYIVNFQPGKEILGSGTNPLRLLAQLRELGEVTVRGDETAVPSLEEIEPEGCYLGWEVTLDTDAGLDAIKDVFIFVEDECTLDIREVPGPGAGRAPVPRATAREAAAGDHGDGAGRSTVRVPSARLDKLVNLAGELVTVRARLSQLSAERDDPVLLNIAEEVDRYVSELRENVISLRMVPVGTLFGQLRRVARDVARDLGKEVDLLCEGDETELDKSVVESLKDSLVHLVRNCVDHGIEPAAERVAAGKPARGTVRLVAGRAGAHVVIEVGDDGAGLNVESIRAVALERNLLAPGAIVTDAELAHFVFTPGFSTAEAVTDVSGRGVGLDVVKKRIEHLRGSVEVASRPGAGMTVSLKIPLTLAIIDGLLVRVAGQRYVMPLSLVEECVDLDERRGGAARPYVSVRGEMVPLVRLREAFGGDGDAPERMTVVLGRVAGARVGLVVDQVLGGQQVMIKSLGRFLKDSPGVSGATLLGDGSVALILELEEIIGWAAMRESASTLAN